MNNFEVPSEILNLYRYWQLFDAGAAKLKKAVYSEQNLVDLARLKEVEDFAKKRMEAWYNRLNDVYPTSDDSIIAKFKFCNTYRELDRQTIYFHTKLNEFRGDFSFWLLNMFAARFLANIDTFDAVGFLDLKTKNTDYFAKLKSLKKPKFGNAYVFPISTIQNSPWPTREEFLSFYVPEVIDGVAKVILAKQGRTVNELLLELLPAFKFNHRFLWTEVLIDVHYQFPELVELGRDFYIGPGARPSLEYLREGKTDLSLILDSLAREYPYIEGVNLSVKGNATIPLSAENWEGICCEFRKYQNLKSGKGRRRRYV